MKKWSWCIILKHFFMLELNDFKFKGWWCRKNHQWATRFQHAWYQTCPTQKKTLQRVPVWYRPKTLWRLSQKRAPTMLESMSFREIVRTFSWGSLGFYSLIEPDSFACRTSLFLMGKILINVCIFQNSTHVGILQTRANCVSQVFSV